MGFQRVTTAAIASLAVAATLVGGAEAALTGFALTSNGQQIVAFDPGNPAGATTLSVTGDASRLDAFDFRPATGELIGFDSATDRYFVIDTSTGATTRIDDGAAVVVPQSNVLDVDWNPTIDRMRLVTGANDNVVFNPTNGATTQVTDLFYGVGDVSEGVDPTIVGNAYTNSFAGAGATVQYVLDAATDSLGALANNAGAISTIAPLTLGGSSFFFGTNGGFDIFSGGGGEVAYALLFGGGLTSLFTLDVATGGLTKLGDFSANLGGLKGLAITDINEVPLPAALPMFAMALGGLSMAARRRKAPAAPL